MITIIKQLVQAVRPRDFLEASGPLVLILLFAYVLVAIRLEHEPMVALMSGLMFWPAYQFIGYLVENSVMNFRLSRKTRKHDDIQMAVAALVVLVMVMSLFGYSHWVLVVVALQMLPMLFDPLESWNQDQGCFNAVFKSLLLFGFVILIIFGLPETLSKSYPLPYLDNAYRYLPGMMMLGMVYYLMSAIIDVLMQPLIRGDIKGNIRPEINQEEAQKVIKRMMKR